MATARNLASNFPHLSLPLIVSDRARLPSGGSAPEQEQNNKANRKSHGANLLAAASGAVLAWSNNRQERTKQNLPSLPQKIPLFLEVEPGSDLEYLRKQFELEIVSEHDDGIVLVSSSDQDMAKFFNTTLSFIDEVRGGATAAKIYNLSGPENSKLRIERILSDSLLEKWPSIDDAKNYIIDVGIECLGTISVSDTPEIEKGETPEHFEVRLAKWKQKWQTALNAWDDLQLDRENEFLNFIKGYQGEVLDIVHDSHSGPASLPDSFSVRVNVSGLAFRDLVLNYPYLFEVSDPDDVVNLSTGAQSNSVSAHQFQILPPDEDAPAVCVIDSGIQESHPFLASAVDTSSSICLIPGESATDVADYVSSGGHGTRVAGAIVFPQGIPQVGEYKISSWIQNARVLDQQNRLSSRLYPPTYLRAIVSHFHGGPRTTRLFNHSIAAYRPCKLRNMSAWAATIDWLSWEYDVLFFQSAGNLPHNSSALPFRLGVLDHLNSGFAYPDYLNRDSSRIPSPSESLQAITVGSVSHADYVGLQTSAFAGKDRCSAFSTTGLGVWSSVKPEVVEYGGDFAINVAHPPSITTPPEVCPELVRSTFHGGPLFARDEVGTSYAAPKVAAIGSRIQSLFPNETSLLYRALIVNSARWPTWAEEAGNKLDVIRQLGYGIPDMGRATENTTYRVTLIASGENRVKPKEAQIYQIPVPEAMRSPGEEFNVRIDVTLSYVAKPRRTRRSVRQYLSTWVDWRSSQLGESVESFKNRVLRAGDTTLQDGDGVIQWKIREQDDWGEVVGVRRGTSTVQKDWVVLKSHQLPTDFCVAVVGHPGWDKDPDSYAKYSLVVSFEAIDQDIEIYNQIEAAVSTVIPVQEVEMEIRVS